MSLLVFLLQRAIVHSVVRTAKTEGRSVTVWHPVAARCELLQNRPHSLCMSDTWWSTAWQVHFRCMRVHETEQGRETGSELDRDTERGSERESDAQRSFQITYHTISLCSCALTSSKTLLLAGCLNDHRVCQAVLSANKNEISFAEHRCKWSSSIGKQRWSAFRGRAPISSEAELKT